MIEINEEVRTFLIKNKKLINTNDFKELYQLALSNGTLCPCQLTEVFMLSGIDPLRFMTEVPISYLEWSLLSIDTINIPDSITTIKEKAFAETNIKYINIPEGVTTIGSRCFYNCCKLEMVRFPSTLNELSRFIFLKCTNIREIHYNGTYTQFCEISRHKDWFKMPAGRYNDQCVLVCTDKTVKLGIG